MGFIFGRKKKELENFENKEEQETCKELEDIDAILLKFNILTRNLQTFNEHNERYSDFLDALEARLHDMKVHNGRLTVLAKKLEDDLIALRAKAGDKTLLKLTKREKEVLEFGQNLTRHIDQTAKLVCDFKGRAFRDDDDYKKYYARLCGNLSGLKKLLEELFDLERSVGKLTLQFLDDDDEEQGE